MTFKELKIMRMKDKENKNYIMMLIDTIEKLAKDKNPTNPNPDLFIVDGLKKSIKQVEDSIKNGVDAEDELNFLKKLAEEVLPKQMSDDELEVVLHNLVASGKNFGECMKELKVRQDIDMKKASAMLKEIFASLKEQK